MIETAIGVLLTAQKDVLCDSLPAHKQMSGVVDAVESRSSPWRSENTFIFELDTNHAVPTIVLSLFCDQYCR